MTTPEPKSGWDVLREQSAAAAATKPEMLLLLSDARGVYIPRDFAQLSINREIHVSGISSDDWQILERGPDHELYWEVWNKVEQNAVVIDTEGHKYRLYQDGDLWLVPEGMEWCNACDGFHWPDPEDAKT